MIVKSFATDEFSRCMERSSLLQASMLAALYLSPRAAMEYLELNCFLSVLGVYIVGRGGGVSRVCLLRN